MAIRMMAFGYEMNKLEENRLKYLEWMWLLAVMALLLLSQRWCWMGFRFDLALVCFRNIFFPPRCVLVFGARESPPHVSVQSLLINWIATGRALTECHANRLKWDILRDEFIISQNLFRFDKIPDCQWFKRVFIGRIALNRLLKLDVFQQILDGLWVIESTRDRVFLSDCAHWRIEIECGPRRLSFDGFPQFSFGWSATAQTPEYFLIGHLWSLNHERERNEFTLPHTLARFHIHRATQRSRYPTTKPT